MRNLVFCLVVFTVIDLGVSRAVAQDAAPPAGSEAQRDQEWLTAYMMAHQGYRLDHMDALEDTFSKMTPTQLGTLKDFYEQKHAATMRQQELFHRAQALQLSMGEANIQRQMQGMNQINQEQSAAANLEDQRLARMHQEAAAASQEKSMMSPYGFGAGYGSGYGIGYGNPMNALPYHPSLNPYLHAPGY